MAAVQYQIWLYARPNYRQQVDECGLFDSEDAALPVGAAVQRWLRDGDWDEAVLGPVLDRHPDPEFPTTDRDLLGGLPKLLRAQGIDPARVLVTAGPAKAGAVLVVEEYELDCDDFEDEDTVLELPDVHYEVNEGEWLDPNE